MTLRVPRAAVAVLAAAGAALAWWRVSTADERRVLRVLREVSELAEKGGAAENPVLAALDVGRLSKLVDARVELLAPELGGASWTEKREDLVRHAFAAKARASRLSLSFGDVSVRFPSKGRATAVAEATLEGSTPDFGGAFGGTRRVSVSLRRDPSSGAWLVTRVAAVPAPGG